jgi:hypothetical protein
MAYALQPDTAMERWVLTTLLAGCTVRPAMPEPGMPAPAAEPPGTYYGHELVALDLAAIATVDVSIYEADKHHASQSRSTAIIAGGVFVWAAAEGAIHVANDHPLGAAAGPPIKFGIPYLLMRTEWAGRHIGLATAISVAAMIVDDALIANRSF